MRLSFAVTGQFCCRIFILSAMALAVGGLSVAQNPKTNSSKFDNSQTFEDGGESIAIPAPWSGMVELGPDHRAAMNQLVPPYNRLVAAFVPSDKVQNLSQTGETPPRIALIEVSRQYEFTNITADGFKRIVDGVAKQFDATVDSYAKDNERQFNDRLESLDLNDVKIAFDKPISLGALFSMPDAAGFGTILRVSASDSSSQRPGQFSSTKALSVLYLRVKNRVLYAYVFANYENVETAKWLRSASQNWATAIVRANN